MTTTTSTKTSNPNPNTTTTRQPPPTTPPLPLLLLGGTKGHILETIDPHHHPLFVSLYRHLRWKPIPHCTGRYTCRDHDAVCHLPPWELLRRYGRFCHGWEDGDGEGETEKKEREWKVYYFPLVMVVEEQTNGNDQEDSRVIRGRDRNNHSREYDNDEYDNGDDRVGKSMMVCDNEKEEKEIGRRNRDPMYVIPFGDDGSTGLITYVKRYRCGEGNRSSGDEQPHGVCATRGNNSASQLATYLPNIGEEQCRYVHTLNSMSGFRRKLEAVGLVLTDEFLVSR